MHFFFSSLLLFSSTFWMRWIKVAAFLVKSFTFCYYYCNIAKLKHLGAGSAFSSFAEICFSLPKMIFTSVRACDSLLLRLWCMCVCVREFYRLKSVRCFEYVINNNPMMFDVLIQNSHDFDTVSVSNFQINFRINKTPRRPKLL